MLYRDVDALCAGLTTQGFNVSVITNGWFSERVVRIARQGHIHAVSISFDGLPCVHDVIRRRAGAFEKALSGLKTLVGAGQKTGTVFQALRYVGRDRVDDQVIGKLARLLDDKDRAMLSKQSKHVPAWMHPVVQQIVAHA